MKSKLPLYISALTLLCTSAFAQAIYPHAGAAEEPAYLLNVHGCDLQGMSAGSRSVPIKRNSNYVALVVAPSRYWKIQSSVEREIARAKGTSAELKKTKTKVAEFEDVGNIPAMKHWEQKAAAIELEITREVNRRLQPKFAQEIIASERPATYYSRSEKDKYRTNTLQELIDVTSDNCVVN